MMSFEPFIGPLEEQVYIDVAEKYKVSLDDQFIHEVTPYYVIGRDTEYVSNSLLRARDTIRNARIDKTGATSEGVFRTEFEAEVNNLEQKHDRLTDLKLGIMIIRLDFLKFKDINDTLGHDGADDLMAKIVAYFRTITRANSGDQVARLGGDEFILKLNFDEEEITKEEFLEIIEKRMQEFPISDFKSFEGFRWNHALHTKGLTAKDMLNLADIKGPNEDKGYVRDHAKSPELNAQILENRLAAEPALSK